MNPTNIVKSSYTHVICLSLLISIASIHVFPQFQNKVIAGGDVISSTAWSHQVQDYKANTGESSKWNPSMFSGMPWGLLSVGSEKNMVAQVFVQIRKVVAPPASILFKVGIFCYIALILLRIHPLIALLGSLAFCLNVNFIGLLEAGHQSKLRVLANFPILLSGLILCFNKDHLKGFCAIAFATALAISDNHIQMLYYLLLVFVCIALVYLFFAIKENKLPSFFKSSSIALGAAILGALANFSVLSSSLSFAEDTMRGKPILAQTAQTNSSSSSKDGLNWDYAMQWSNDSKDLASLFIPSFVGGSNGEEVSAKSTLGRLLQQNNAKRKSDGNYLANMYWGNLPITSSPVYHGISLMLLFMISLFFVDKRTLISLVLASSVIVALSMGKNFAIFNESLFNILPLFDKFRAPSSAITILPLFVIFLSCIGLQKFIKAKISTKKQKKIIYASLAFTAILGAIALIAPSFLSFESVGDGRYSDEVKNIFIKTRKEHFFSDTWRSIIFALLTFSVIFAFMKNWFKSKVILFGLLTLIIVVDLVNVNLRYLDIDKWESQRAYSQKFAVSQTDQQIFNAEPKGRGYYRLLDIPQIRTAVPSYHHNTIGGYHAAKLQRYEDMLQNHIYRSNSQVLNMLNAKYIISGNGQLQTNPQALGNAWSISNVEYVTTAKEELDKLSSINTAETAIVNKTDFPDTNIDGFAKANVTLNNYTPNKLTYTTESNGKSFIVFSEVWYERSKGLLAKIDGVEAKFIRVNYLLRGLEVPTGKHEIVFEFKPRAKAGWVSTLSSLMILLLTIFAFLKYNDLIPPKWNKALSRFSV